MKKNILISLIIAIVVFGIFAWSPWISGQYAKKRAVAEFERTWINVADGCGFACHGCGETFIRDAKSEISTLDL